MIDNTPDNHIEAMTGDEVEVDGVYVNEAGREEILHRGEKFPGDLTLGRTTWKMVGFALNEENVEHIKRDNTDPRTQVYIGR
ncbi:hypothetical protein ACFFK0_27825 [Paenibacillus chartarius]|uniref:Transposase n=1 Tax=Paenibacillus chartarius TaxID=747481 RepID=A0ABV6DU67_9BACL